jgi:hypothetical protein
MYKTITITLKLFAEEGTIFPNSVVDNVVGLEQDP